MAFRVGRQGDSNQGSEDRCDNTLGCYLCSNICKISFPRESLMIEAQVALPVRNDIFFKTFAKLAMGKKNEGKRGDKTSKKILMSSIIAEIILQRLGSLSKLLPRREWPVPILEAKRIPPSCPTPSFMTQLSAAAAGAEVLEPTPTASRSEWVDKIIKLVPEKEAKKEDMANCEYPLSTVVGYPAGMK
eukprot:CAMPEP_0184874066 /NCGR_PEP_ID=MMETSP0580-20130426/42186_1 /TAXON_ID=1118495 /ORGANISM="Dactyliosolen fragilissimus" /LENGTH=187 /DNA_ID=CAMNT_0027377033 /DNA_START=932 /DNA_END=1496 /DNA_ORIENTATION=+